MAPECIRVMAIDKLGARHSRMRHVVRRRFVGAGRPPTLMSEQIRIATWQTINVTTVMSMLTHRVGRYKSGDGKRRCRLGRIENDLDVIARMNAVELRDGRPARAVGCAIPIDLQDGLCATRILQHPDEI